MRSDNFCYDCLTIKEQNIEFLINKRSKLLNLNKTPLFNIFSEKFDHFEYSLVDAIGETNIIGKSLLISLIVLWTEFLDLLVELSDFIGFYANARV